MKIIRNADQPSGIGPEEYFTGTVRTEQMFKAPAPARAGGAIVHFQPGARTAWHTHPAGQMLYVLTGMGWVQREGEDKQVILPGDTVWFEPGERHWHGATDTKAMSHVAIAETVDGRAVDWADKVTDDDYLR